MSQRFDRNEDKLQAPGHENTKPRFIIMDTGIMFPFISDFAVSLSVVTTDKRLYCLGWMPSALFEINTDYTRELENCFSLCIC